MSRHPDSCFPSRDAARAPARTRRLARAAALVLALPALAPRPAGAATRDASALAPKSDVQITVVPSAGFTTGSSATYTLTVNNNGPQGAVGPITVTNTLPAGLTYTSAIGVGWVCSATGQVVTCTRAGTLGKNVPETIAIVAFITPATPASVTNVATAAYPGNDDSDLTNNTATTTSAVAVRGVSTTPDAAAVTQLPSNGVSYTQTFVVTNTGTVSDSYTLVATVAPAGVATVVSVAGVAGSSATTTPVAAGATRNVDVVYSVATAAATGASATLTLTATSIATGVVTDPGSIAVTVTRAGVTMSKQLYRDDRTTLVTGGAAVSTGEYVQYRVTVTNGGGAGATTVSVADPIPGQVTYDSATPDAAGWTVATAAGTLTANLAGTLAVGASRYFWIRVRVK